MRLSLRREKFEERNNMTILPSELEPIADHILFQFLEDTESHGQNLFKSRTDWGFELTSSHQDTTKTPRWVKIVGLGPDVSEEFHIGQVVLLEALRWTRQVEYQGIQFARTDPDQIIAIDEET